MHSKDLRAAGETEQRLYLLGAWRESPFYSERERAALAWAEAVTLLTNKDVPDDVYEQARSQFTVQQAGACHANPCHSGHKELESFEHCLPHDSGWISARHVQNGVARKGVSKGELGNVGHNKMPPAPRQSEKQSDFMPVGLALNERRGVHFYSDSQ